METKDPENSVHGNEPFSKNTENMKDKNDSSPNKGKESAIEGKIEEPVIEHKAQSGDNASREDTPATVSDSAGNNEVSGPVNMDQASRKEEADDSDEKNYPAPERIESDHEEGGRDADEGDSGEEGTGASLNAGETIVGDIGENEAEKEDKNQEKTNPVSSVETEDDAEKESGEEEDFVHVDLDTHEEKREIINYALLSKPDLLKMLKELIDSGKINEIASNVAAIKSSFYRQHRSEIEEKKANFLNSGGNEEDFSPGYSDDEEELKALLKKYSDLKAEVNKLREDEKTDNLTQKYEIIEEIKDLVHRDESINKTFQEFRELQKKWHEIGIVPQSELKNLWDTYHYHVEKFYDYIKINKELRDLDLKKNLELKIDLCEKAEALLLEPNIVNAFKTLQKFHDQWREIGPVPKEQRTEIWERFREATSKINKNHQQYYHDLKENQKKNLESKIVLCEKAEEISSLEITEHELWVEKTREIIDIQKVWKTIGFAPKKDNNKIYARFRAACDTFFNRKREFYALGLEEQQENLQKKLDLCIQAEALQDSTDWKKSTDELILLQRKWKKIGPVPRKKSDQVWKRFRAACDKFFDRKSEFFSHIEDTYDKNLVEKTKLIEEIKAFTPGESLKENLNQLNEYQRRWSEIGFVPFDKKDEIMQLYRDAINDKYDILDMDEHKKNVLKFKNKLDDIKNKPRPQNKLRFEREKLMNKLQQMKNDIVVWENNIGFFAESKKADTMVKEFEKKIESARRNIKLLEDKILMIDDMDD